MSIDANVLVFERIKEELAQGKALSAAIAAGYKKAFSAILDSNVTTIIASLILLNFDAGPIKSFAMNLIIGITASMFTALFMTRVYFTYWAQNPKRKILTMAHWIRDTAFNFLKRARLAFALSLGIIAVGCGAFLFHSSSIFGLDFTGGYSLHLNIQEASSQGSSYAHAVAQAFLKKGADKQDFQVQELNPSNQLRILLAENMNNEGKPFFGFALENGSEGGVHLYEKNPRIVWVVDALKEAGIVIEEASLARLHAEWTSVSGQMSNAMKTQAILGFSLSFLAIFIYLAFRFEYKFAAAAVLCLIHDLLITLAAMGILHALHVPIQIDLITIAALMTAVGYSLNDTIIIFDRIREEMQRSIKYSLGEIVNIALNSTLSRTLITSGTTLFVLIALLILGGNSIFGFACVMTIGVIFGTLSSWFIAAPLMLLFHSKEEGQKNVWAQLSQHVK
jgi:SecD/SecF fusion protein